MERLGNDRGTEEGRAVEKEINLAIALKVKELLEEMGFLSNYAERTDLMDAGYQDELAAELAEGIVKGLEGV